MLKEQNIIQSSSWSQDGAIDPPASAQFINQLYYGGQKIQIYIFPYLYLIFFFLLYVGKNESHFLD